MTDNETNEKTAQQFRLNEIPGTYVFDKNRSRAGYHLNMFCMSLNKPENRQAFRSDEAAYLQKFPMTDKQRHAVLERDWVGMLRLGGNIYYTFKIAICDRISMQAVGGAMSGISEDEFRQIMLTGGKDVFGNSRNGPNVLERSDD